MARTPGMVGIKFHFIPGKFHGLCLSFPFIVGMPFSGPSLTAAFSVPLSLSIG
jgi:hypothetical protein